jgi:predicted nucleic acid-binding protein
VNPLFIDSGPFVAVANPGDQYEEAATRTWRRLADEPRPLISSEHVLDEVGTAITRTQGASRAAAWLRGQLSSGLIRWLQTASTDLDSAIEWLEKYSDQRLSFTDAVSITLMRRERIDDVFTFDRHFTIAGFNRWPDA